MDELTAGDIPAEPPGDGIYSTCPTCLAIVASAVGHQAWHESRGEAAPDAHD